MLDAAISQMQVARDRPWQPVPEDLEARYAIGQADQGDLVARLVEEVLPHHGGNIHPRFWGWVQGSGLPSDMIASVAAAAVNANMGGRDHGANYMERAVVDWTRASMGLPEGASGSRTARSLTADAYQPCLGVAPAWNTPAAPF